MIQNQNPLSIMNLLQGDFCYKVKGINGANQFPLGPNSRAPLFDEDNNILFIKTTDANNEYTIDIYDFSKREEEYPEKYLTVQKFDDYMSDLRKEILDAQLDIQQTLKSFKSEVSNGTDKASAENPGNSSKNAKSEKRINNYN